MKTLKLNKMANQHLAEKEMRHIIGGNPGDGSCGYGCCYTGNGGSSIMSNGMANSAGGRWSTGCPIQQIYLPGVTVYP